MQETPRCAMAEKQSQVDYGVQIRFINDLQEPRRPPKARGKSGSYGVAVRVQGIAGQPFVVLNSGEKGSDSFGVQIKSNGSYPTPAAGPLPSGSISSDSDLPENPYGGQQPRHGSSYSASDEEPSGASAAPRGTRQHQALAGGKTAAGSSEVDTNPLSSVDSLISKFDGKVQQQRGRAARRGRVPSEERKRSQSLDSRISHRDVPDARELSSAQRQAGGAYPQPSAPTGSLRRPGGQQDLEGCGETRVLARAEPFCPTRQLKSTPDLLRDQREVAQPGSSEYPKELIYSILKEGSSESEISLKRKTARLLEKMQELAVSWGHPSAAPCLQGRPVPKPAWGLPPSWRCVPVCRGQDPAGGGWGLSWVAPAIPLRRFAAAQPGRHLCQELQETREELEEALSSRQRQEEQLRLRERELTALKGALKEEVASHDKELDRVRQQYQSDMDQLRRSMEGISQDQANLESEKQKINTVVRNLQRELEESAEETGHWRDMFQKNKDELRSTKQERSGRWVPREQAPGPAPSTNGPDSPSPLSQELRQAREAQREVAAEKQSQEELLRQREQELAALKGTMREEATSRDGELERYRRDLRQLQQERDEATKAKASLESTREELEQARKTVESTLREVQEQNDDLRRKVLGMESQLKEYERMGENWEGSQTRLKEKVTKLEAERRQMEDSLGEATEREQELLMAKRLLETRLEEAQRSLARLTQEHQELSASYQDEQRQKEQLKRAKSELEEQKRLLDRTTEKLNKELEQMTAESQSSLTVLKSQLEEFKEKSRKEITDSQKQAKDRGAEVEKMQFSMGRLQDEVARLKQALQDSQAERESVVLDKEVLLQRLHNLEQEMESKRRSQDDRSRHVKALEEKSKRLEVELDEERSTVELLTERVNRSRDQMEQLRAELLQERSSRQDLECDKVSLERQNKELKSRLASSEGLQKPSSNISHLEAQVEELQDKLQAEEREKSVLLSSNRKLERKVKELTIQIDDERQNVSNQKDQLSLRVKALKRQVDEAEEEIERLEGARKKAQRELEEQHELNEQLQNRIKTLEKEAWRKAARSAADSSLQDDRLSSDEEFDSAYGPSSIASLLNEANLQTSSC
uniref:Cingulin n=1 Tax=Strigops habroptila TaxID=2489341 RepID=A0A672UMJ0_STRHB